MRRSLPITLALALLASLALSAAACDDQAAAECQTNRDCPPGYFCHIGQGRCISEGVINGDEEMADVNEVPDDGDTTDGDDPVGTDGDGETGGDPIDDTDPDPVEQADGDTADGDTADPNDSDGTVDGDDDWEAVDFEYESIEGDCRAGEGAPKLAVTDLISGRRVETVDFGAVTFGQYVVRELLLCNEGGQTLSVTGLQFAHATSQEFTKSHGALPYSLAPGKGITIALFYQPRDNAADQGTLGILSNDATRPQVDIGLLGSVKPAGRIRVRPQVLQYFFTGGTKPAVIENVGNAQLTIISVTVAQPGHFALNGFQPPQSTPFVLQPEGGFVNAVVTFDGAAEAGDTDLVIVWNDGETTREEIIRLMAGGTNECAVPDAGPDLEVSPLSVVMLDGGNSMDPNDVAAPGEAWYQWDWQEKPDGATTAILYDRAPNAQNGQAAPGAVNVQGIWTAASTVYFFAELAGRYVVRLRVNPDDDTGCARYDLVEIRVNPDETIHIQVRWDVAGNDTDLHLVRPGGYYTRSGSSNGSDCHYANCNTRNGTTRPSNAPDWGVQGNRADDPTLDIDDIPGVGPENINLSLPELGDYLVGAEYFSGGSNPQVTVKIWIFGVLQGTFRGRIGQSNKHWRVAWIHVSSPTDIWIEPINTICDSNPTNSSPPYTYNCR